jgi:membrane fusion protein (multidrug efflux system)
MPVEAVAAAADTVVDAISATGAIEAVQSIELRPDIEGRLKEILVREGTEVRRGTPLFKVDDGELIHQVARLEAERDLAQQAVKRARDLIEQEALSPADLDAAEANARSTQAQYELQKLRLERTVVLAPFSGIVGERLVSLGDYVTTSTRLTTLRTVDPQRAAFQIPERYAERLDEGQQVTFRVAAVNKEFTGTVDFVDPVVQLPARTITVKARVNNPARDLKPGMFIEASLATDVRADAVVIPEDAILPLEGATYVWVVADGKAQRRAVKLGIRTPGFVEVTDGLDAGEVVVVGGLERLRDGAPVMTMMVERQ